MKRFIFLSTAVVLMVAGGCRTADSNPPAPRANTGYVDFYTDGDLGLSWQVKRANSSTGEMETVFSEYKPVEGRVLRLAAPPGTHRFQVWFSNRVTEGPQTTEVEVQDGKVTPVHVTLSAAGTAAVDSKTYEYRPTPRASRRVTRTTTDEQQMFRIGLAPAAPQSYQPAERMAY